MRFPIHVIRFAQIIMKVMAGVVLSSDITAPFKTTALKICRHIFQKNYRISNFVRNRFEIE